MKISTAITFGFILGGAITALILGLIIIIW